MAGNSSLDSTPQFGWFATAGSAVAWAALGVADVLITWRACLNEPPGSRSTPSAAIAVYLVVARLVFFTALAAGSISYRRWRQVRGNATLMNADGGERGEFSALAGLFITLTLGTGIVWLCLPVLLIHFCTRMR